MSIQPDKNLIKQRFKRSLSTYNEQAQVQLEMSLSIIYNLKELFGDNFFTILEIGSGTGILTQKIIDNFTFVEALPQ